jgi:hypothetical protein
MKKIISPLLVLLLFSFGAPSLWGAEGVIYRAAGPAGYCHLKFPAIREDTLYSDRPALKDPRDGDIIDFYGPCDYDPLGKEEVKRQRAADVLERNRIIGDP